MKSITAVLFAFIAPFLLVGVSAPQVYAADPAPNFKVHVENSASSTGERLFLYTQNLKSTGKAAKFSYTFDDSDNIAVNLQDAAYVGVLFSNQDEKLQRVSSNFSFNVINGQVSSFARYRYYTNENPTSSAVETNTAGYYKLYLGTTGLHVTLLSGSETRTVDVQNIFGANKYSKPINPSYYGDGSVGIDIDAGTYDVVGMDANSGDVGTATACTVTSNTISNCIIRLAEPNFAFRIVTQNLETPTFSASGVSTQISKLDSKGNVENTTNVQGVLSSSRALLDGNYQIRVFKSVMDQKLNKSTPFSVTVVGGAVISVKSQLNNTVLTPTSGTGVYLLPIADDNLKFTVTAGGSAFKEFYSYLRNESTGQYSWGYPDADGKVQIQALEGKNFLYVGSSASGTNYVSTSYYLDVNAGVITEMRKTNGETFTASNGYFSLGLQSANVQGTFTKNGLPGSGYVSSIYDLSLKRWTDVAGTGINSEGKFGLSLPRGSFRISIYGYGTDGRGSLYFTTVDVPESGNTSFTVAAPADNFTFDVLNIQDTKVVNSASASVKRLNSGFPYDPEYGYSVNASGTYKFSLQDGSYSVIVNANDPLINGQSRKYLLNVVGGVVTTVTDAKTGILLTSETGTYHLRLGRANFNAVLHANGAPNPSAYVKAYQEGFNSLGTNANSDGKLGFDLPDGRNEIRIYTTGNESPTVVSALFYVTLESGTVTSVLNESGESLTATAGLYTLDYKIPNIVGKVTRDGVPVQGYVSAVWNTVLNNTVNFGGNNSDSQGNYSVIVPAGNYDILFIPYGGVGGVQNCNAVAGQRLTCDIAFPANNLTTKIKSKNGTILTSGVQAEITRRFGKGQSFAGQGWSFGIGQSSPGVFSSSLVDGDYELYVYSNSPSTDGTSRRFTFTVESSTVGAMKDIESGEIIDSATVASGISLVVPNFNAVISSSGNPTVNSWGYIYSYSKSKDYWKSFNTDSQGKVSFKLADGEYKLQAYPRGNESPIAVRTEFTVLVESNTVTSVKNKNDISAQFSDGAYVLPLTLANLSGTVTKAGEVFADGNAYVGNFLTLDSGKYMDAATVELGGGRYGANIETGTYLVNYYHYGEPGAIDTCTVGSGLNVCNFDLPADNFAFKIQSSDGVDLLQDVRADAVLQSENWSRGYWFRPSVGGVYRAGLKIPEGIEARYIFTVMSSDGSNRHGVARRYVVRVNGESITSVSNFATGETLTPGVDGIYAFRLAAPNIAGTVVAPDGTTPIPNTYVGIESPKNWLGSNTDNSGAFSTFTETDGSYSVWAQAPQFDLTKADSARTNVEVSNGAGNSNLQLKLRTPTVRGTVTGPRGISPFNYIQVFKKDDNGNFEYYGDNIQGRSANSQGRFAFYLDPGIYRFQAEADEENAGGGRSLSTNCVISDTSTIVECPLVMSGYNFKVKLLGANGAIYRDANLYFNYMAPINDAGIRPAKTWDYAYIPEDGIAKMYLEDGQWQGEAAIYGNGPEAPLRLTAVIESGTVISLAADDGETFTVGSSGFFEVRLPSSNLLGTIFDGAKRYDGGASVHINSKESSEKSFGAGRWVSDGKFAFKAPAGTYTIEVYPHGNKGGAASVVRTTRYDCVVPETGTATCDVTLSRPNFSGRITTPNGVSTGDGYAYLQIEREDSEGGKYFDWYEWMQNYNGNFGSYLKDGKYQLNVEPGGKGGGLYTRALYSLTVESGTVTSAKRNLTNETITAVNGVYSFSLSAPSLTGRVFKAGSTTAGVRWASVIAIDAVTNEELWEYSVGSNESGRFAMSLPNGSYFIVARQWGGEEGEGFSSSARYSVTITNGSASAPLDIYMRAPNFKVRVVDPVNTSQGLAKYWVNGNFNNQYFGGSTDSDGYFTAFIDTATTNTCIGDCRIYIYPQYQGKYANSFETFTVVGDIGNISPRIPNATVTVYIPTNGGTGNPDKWAWFSVQTLDSNSEVISEEGYGTNEVGRASISLDAGVKYRITAYPSGEYYGRYSPKSLLINSFDPAVNANITITFESPNVTFIARDLADAANSWGWYEVYTVSGSSRTRYVDGYLNEAGRGAQTLIDGDYSVTFYPGRSRGVEKTITFTVAGGHVTASNGATSTLNDVVTVIMGSGNVTGTIKDSAGEVVPSAVVTAVSGGSPLKSTAVTKADGTYELSLDSTRTWTLTALNPITTKTGSTSISSTPGNSASISTHDITLLP